MNGMKVTVKDLINRLQGYNEDTEVVLLQRDNTYLFRTQNPAPLAMEYIFESIVVKYDYREKTSGVD